MRKTLILILALAVLGLTSCEHKDLCYLHPHVAKIRVDFDWSKAPTASPEGMCVFFYPTDGGSPVRFDFEGNKGGYIEITVGKYQVITYNNDTEAVLFEGTQKYRDHYAYTREGGIFESIYGSAAQPDVPRAKDSEEERVVISPDMLWGQAVPQVEITDDSLSYYITGEDGEIHSIHTAGDQIITLTPEEQICLYTYEVRNVKNLETCYQLCGSLSSMSGGLTLHSGALDTECVTLPFEAVSDGVSNITGGFLTFGHHTANTQKHKMLFYTWLEGGAKYYYTFDVTDQIHNAPNPRRVHIIIDNLELPQPIEGEGGFDAVVDEWQEEYRDIIM